MRSTFVSNARHLGRRLVFDLPHDDQMTLDLDLVDCPGPPRVETPPWLTEPERTSMLEKLHRSIDEQLRAALASSCTVRDPGRADLGGSRRWHPCPCSSRR